MFIFFQSTPQIINYMDVKLLVGQQSVLTPVCCHWAVSGM